MNVISEAGIIESAIEKMNAAMMPSDVASNPFTERGNGKGLKVRSIFRFDFPVACRIIAVFI